MISTLILFIIGFILITKGADIFINCTVEIGKKTHVSELVLGATIVRFATTLPELTVSLCASINNQTTMSLGNAVGSIICNTGLILGLVAFISPFKVDRKMFLSKSTLLLISILGLVIVGLDGTVNEKDSIVLLIILAIFMYTNYKSVTSEKVSKRSAVNLQEKKNTDTKVGELLKIICLFLLGLVMMVAGSRLLVDNGFKFAGIYRNTSRDYKLDNDSIRNIFTRVSIIINGNKKETSCYICRKCIRCKHIKYNICNSIIVNT